MGALLDIIKTLFNIWGLNRHRKLNKQQKGLLKDIKKGIKKGKVKNPFPVIYSHQRIYIKGIEKDYGITLKGDLQILEEQGFILCLNNKGTYYQLL